MYDYLVNLVPSKDPLQPRLVKLDSKLGEGSEGISTQLGLHVPITRIQRTNSYVFN